MLLLLMMTMMAIPRVTSSHVEEKETNRILKEGIDLQEMYDFFASDSVGQGFLTGIIGQFIFSTLGWIFSSTLWSLARGDNIDTDPDLEGLVDFLLSDQIAAANVAIGVGYALVGSIFWIGLAALGEPSTFEDRNQETKVANTLESLQKIIEKEDYDDIKTNYLGKIIKSVKNVDNKVSDNDPAKAIASNVIKTLDTILSLNGFLLNTLINLVLTASFIAFWAAMSFLPERLKNRKKSNEDSFSLEVALQNLNKLHEAEDWGTVHLFT